MLDFEVQRFTRRCAKTDRELQPGEAFYSVLISQGAEVIRQDFAADEWEGPPEENLGWWKSEVPDPKSKKVHWAPNDVMLHYFQQLEDQPHKRDVRYVLTLLLIRRRVLKLEETKKDEQQQETLVVFCPKTETEHSVPVETPANERIEEIQKELAELLFAKTS